MPRLPDLDSLGARPVPVSRSGVVRNQTAGVVGDAIAGIGSQVSQIGQKQFEKQDRLAYASAKAMVASEDVKVRTELANDPDFETANQRYRDHMDGVRANAAKLLGSSYDRKAFEIDSGEDIVRGSAQVSGMVQAKRVDKGRADLGATIENLSKSAADAPDAATRHNIFETVNELVSGAKDNGYISAQEAGTMARGFVANDAGNRIEMALANDKVDDAARILEDAKDALPTNRYTDYHKMVMGKMQARETYDDTSVIMGGGWKDDQGSPVNYADPLRGRGQGVTDAYGVDRGGGKTHNGVDFAAAKGTPIHAIGAGKVVEASSDSKSGNFIIIDHGDGTTSSYSHMASSSPLKAGDLVTPDTVLGAVGSTGHSTGPHLHLVVREKGETVDPQKVIGKAQQEPKRHDLDALLGQADAIAAQQGWSFERRERAKDEIRRRVSLDEGLKARQEGEADRQAQEIILKQNDKFTDAGSIPRPLWEKMSVGQRQSAMDLAERNKKSVEGMDVKPNGPAIMIAHAMMYSDPDKFRDMDLTPFVGQVNKAELDSLISEQARLRNPANNQDVSPRSQVSETINYHTKTDPILERALDPKNHPEAYGRVATDMEATLRAITGGKRQATDAEKDAAFNKATMNVMVKGGSWFGLADAEKPRYALKGGEAYVADVPDDVKARIVSSYRRTHGQIPNDVLISRIYVAQKGKAGFW